MKLVESAPLLCAGITTFNALRHCGGKPGELVAIHGIGGLGHLGVQFAARQGFRTVAINRGRDKENLARSLGAHAYIDSATDDPAKALQAMGGEKRLARIAGTDRGTLPTFIPTQCRHRDHPPISAVSHLRPDARLRCPESNKRK